MSNCIVCSSFLFGLILDLNSIDSVSNRCCSGDFLFLRPVGFLANPPNGLVVVEPRPSRVSPINLGLPGERYDYYRSLYSVPKPMVALDGVIGFPV